jgi:hypothetical protein
MIAVVATARIAHAQDAGAPPAPDTTPPAPPPPAAPDTAPSGPTPDDDMGDQDISAQLGIASGSHVTAGGLQLAGHYLYQLSDTDWFDGVAAFTFGSSSAGCFHDRSNALVCDHGFADGRAGEVAASIRRMFTPQGQFRPFARIGIGIGGARFPNDDVSGLIIPLHAGGGVRVKVAPSVAVVAEAEVNLGFSELNHDLGSQLQFGFDITAGAEFRLR